MPIPQHPGAKTVRGELSWRSQWRASDKGTFVIYDLTHGASSPVVWSRPLSVKSSLPVLLAVAGLMYYVGGYLVFPMTGNTIPSQPANWRSLAWTFLDAVLGIRRDLLGQVQFEVVRQIKPTRHSEIGHGVANTQSQRLRGRRCRRLAGWYISWEQSNL